MRAGGSPRQNRVTPFGTIEASPDRGLLMGNRGILHDAFGRLGAARWRHPHWIACALSFKDRHRPIMAPGAYTELFFCDEAVALAAGHRPCAECRRADFRRFAHAFGRGAPIPAPAIDAELHGSRVRRDRTQQHHDAPPEGLPDGAFVMLPEAPDVAWLVWSGALHRWSHAGYRERQARPSGGVVTVLTPPPTVRALSAGYVPRVHPTAG